MLSNEIGRTFHAHFALVALNDASVTILLEAAPIANSGVVQLSADALSSVSAATNALAARGLVTTTPAKAAEAQLLLCRT